MAITVTDINDNSPVFSSAETASVAENLTAVVYTAASTDADAGTTLTYSLSGTDASLFAIDADTGEVSFISSPDFENPADAGGDNVYDIIVTASDGTNSTDQSVTITVADVFESITIDLSSLTAAQGFIIQGDDARDQTGRSVSLAGDVNGDGYDDLIIGAHYGDDGGTNAGEAYVIYGGPDVTGVIDLSGLTTAQGFVIQGAEQADLTGESVSSAGDVNGDGYDDLIVGARLGDGSSDRAGEAYVVYGGPSATGVIDLSALSATQGFVILGDEPVDELGRSVSSAGDVNGDGYDDLIIGATGADGNSTRAGEAYVIYGGPSVAATIDLSNLMATQGFIVQGDATADRAGNSVSSAGDVNGDGFDDLIIGAPYGNDGGADAGAAYVVYGGPNITGLINLSILTSTQGFIIQGDMAGDRAGFSVSSAGDVNGDGYDDLIVGAVVGDDGGSSAGEAYVIYGGPAVTGVIDLSSLTTAQGFIIQGDSSFDRAGFSVSSAGDVNGDGFDDLIVGAPDGNAAGEAYVVYGGSSITELIDLSALSSAEGFTIQGDEAGDRAGRSVSSAGDVNGDGYDDLILGAPYGDDGGTDAGEAYVVYGGATGTEDTTSVTLAGTAAADNFTGNAGDDVFTDIGLNDVVRGGAGDDTISVSSLDFADIDGGNGSDTLILDGSGLSLDLSSVSANGVDNFDVIDLTGTGNNTCLLYTSPSPRDKRQSRMPSSA